MKPFYQDDFATIYHGDCREIVPALKHSFRCSCGSIEPSVVDFGPICPDCGAVRPMLVADALITDPPYGVGMGSQDHPSGKDSYASFDDTELNIQTSVAPAISLAISRTKRAAILPGTRCMSFYPRPYEVGSVYFPAGFGFSRWGFCCSQPVLFYGKDPKPITRKEPNSFSCTFGAEKNGHPCPKPIEIMLWLVSRASKSDETILDPFMGSGTTLVAAKQLGRKSIGIELEEKYCEIAAERLQQEYLPLTIEQRPEPMEQSLL